MKNLSEKLLSSQSMENIDIKREFHKLIVLQSKEPIIIDRTTNKDEILTLLGRHFQIIKQYTKEFFKENYGFFPHQSEGNCKDCSDKVLKILKADLIWGYFTVDRPVDDIDLIVPTRMGINRISDTNEDDSTQISHWWVEMGEYIIDLTVEQFNKFLDPSSEKYEPIEVLHKKESKAQRYIGKERHKQGRFAEDPYNEKENIDWENADGGWQKRTE
jgi:hypothetical protein